MPRIIQDKKSVDAALDKLCTELSKTNPGEAYALRRQGGGPLVEESDNHDSQFKKVTFYYYDEKEEGNPVYLQSQIGFLPKLKERFGTPKEFPPLLPMQKMDGSNIWAVTVEIPIELCTEYSFATVKVAGEIEWRFDPLNPKLFSGFPNDPNPNSVFDLSPLPKIELQKMAKIKKEGRLKKFSIDAEGNIVERADNYYPKNNERIFTVHFPENCDKTDLSMRLFLDGRWYLESLEVPTMFDDDKNTINIMLEPKPTVSTEEEAEIYFNTRTEKGSRPKDPAEKDREQEYKPENMHAFTKFLKEVFVPYVQKKFNISTEPSKNIICGSSLSGFAAAYVGLHCPEKFGNVLTQSATLADIDGNDLLLSELNSQTLPIQHLKQSCFHLEAGSLESNKWHLDPGRRLKNALREQGIQCEFIERKAGHLPTGWSRHLPDAVTKLRSMRENLEQAQKSLDMMRRASDKCQAQAWFAPQESGEPKPSGAGQQKAKEGETSQFVPGMAQKDG